MRINLDNFLAERFQYCSSTLLLANDLRMFIFLLCLDAYIPKRTTIILEDDIYKRLIEESMKKYGTPKAISKVINYILRRALGDVNEIIKLLYSEKYVKVNQRDIEEFRREFSKRIEER